MTTEATTKTIEVPSPKFGTETRHAAQHLADAAWKLRNGYSAGGSTVVSAVAQLCDDAARAIDANARTTYEGRYPRGKGAPDSTDILELTFEERKALPARFHRPFFMDLTSPSMWMCTACWSDDGELTSWPCGPATAGGVDVAQACGLECSR